MRRTWLAVVVVVSGMVGIGVGSVYAYDAVVGDPPAGKTSVSVYLPPAPAPGAQATDGADGAPGDETQSGSDDTPAATPAAAPDGAAEPVEHVRGVLSEDFRKLGLDDPTTVSDESVKSACEVGGTAAGPALCP